MGLVGNCSHFINLSLHNNIFYDSLYYQVKDDLCRILRVSTSSSFLWLFSFFINWYVFGFISYFVSDPSRKGHRGLEYQCSFVRLYLFLFAFLIICTETFYIFDYLYWEFRFFVHCFVTLANNRCPIMFHCPKICVSYWLSHNN